MSEWSCENALGRVLGRRTSLLAGVAVAVAAVLAVPSLASAQDETFKTSLGFISIPGNPLLSWDISWTDSASQRNDSAGLNEYFLADRSNAAVQAVPLQINPPVFPIRSAAFPFAGNTGNNNTAGPNGVITFLNGSVPELWVGDGPTASSVCSPAGSMCSTVKVFQGLGATLGHVINTGGVNRADELCFDKAHNVVVIANDADTPPFISFIPTTGPNAYQVVRKISMTGAVLPGGNGQGATNGIEQCQYDPDYNLILLNIPEVGGPGDDTAPGALVVIDGGTMSVVEVIQVPINQCAGPQGLAVGPAGSGDFVLGCNAPSIPSGVQNSVIFHAGAFVTLAGLGGVDEAWFEPQSNHYFLAQGSFIPTQQLGIVDAITRNPDQSAFVGFSGSTTRRSHSVSAWAGSLGPGPGLPPMTIALVPVAAVGGTPAPFSSTACVGTTATANQGCVGLWAAPLGSDPVDGNM